MKFKTLLISLLVEICLSGNVYAVKTDKLNEQDVIEKVIRFEYSKNKEERELAGLFYALELDKENISLDKDSQDMHYFKKVVSLMDENTLEGYEKNYAFGVVFYRISVALVVKGNIDRAIDAGNIAMRHLIKALNNKPENEKNTRLFWLVVHYLSGTFPSDNININNLNAAQEMLNTVDCNVSEDVNLCLSMKQTNQENINKNKKRIQNKE